MPHKTVGKGREVLERHLLIYDVIVLGEVMRGFVICLEKAKALFGLKILVCKSKLAVSNPPYEPLLTDLRIKFAILKNAPAFLKSFI